MHVRADHRKQKKQAWLSHGGKKWKTCLQGPCAPAALLMIFMCAANTDEHNSTAVIFVNFGLWIIINK